MADEPDAGGQSSDDDTADATGGAESPVDGSDPEEREGGSVDSQAGSEPGSEAAGSSVDGAERDGTAGGDDHEDGVHPDGGDDGSTAADDGSTATDDEPTSNDAESPTVDEEDAPAADGEARPIGAVTDASTPPSESSSGHGGDEREGLPAGADGDVPGESADGGSGVDDDDATRARPDRDSETGPDDRENVVPVDPAEGEGAIGPIPEEELADPEQMGEDDGPVPDDEEDPLSDEEVYGLHEAETERGDASADADGARPDAKEPRPLPARDADDTLERPPKELPDEPPEEPPEGPSEPPDGPPEPSDSPAERPPEELPDGPSDDLPEGLAQERPEGPPDDEEMPLADHIEEMILRLAMVCSVAAVAAGGVFFFEPLAEDTIMFIWQSVIPHQDMKVHPLVGGTTHPGHYIEVEAVGSSNPRVYGPLELKLTELKFASLVGFVLALPVFVYETYRFMRPGLYPNERRYYLAAVPTSLVLAFVGISFSYFIILPAIFAYFVRYSERAGVLAFALRQTFDLILILMGYMALVFQIPLFIMLAIMMGLTDRRWLEDRRLYFWGGFLGVSFLFVPEPTGMAPILVALTMVGLFEGTLALLRWTGN